MSQPHHSEFNTEVAAQQVRLKTLVRKFCERTGFWINVKQSCTAFSLRKNSNSFDPFLVNFTFSHGDIEDYDLIHLITREPKQFESILEELISIFAEERQQNITVEQIHLNIVVLNLPLIPLYTFTWATVHLNCALTTFRCIVQSFAGPFQYIRQSLWKCSSCIGLPHIIYKNRKSFQKAVNCRSCQNGCKEVVSQRLKSKYCTARVFQAEHFNADRSEFGAAFTIELKIYDEQCQELKLGAEYVVTGIFQPYPNFYEVWSISPVP